MHTATEPTTEPMPNAAPTPDATPDATGDAPRTTEERLARLETMVANLAEQAGQAIGHLMQQLNATTQGAMSVDQRLSYYEAHCETIRHHAGKLQRIVEREMARAATEAGPADGAREGGVIERVPLIEVVR